MRRLALRQSAIWAARAGPATMILALVTAVWLTSAPMATAQETTEPPMPGDGSGTAPAAVAFPVVGVGVRGHRGVGTAVSTGLHGAADAVRAGAEANLINAEALGRLEHARSLAMDNWLKRIEVRQQARRLGLAAREEERRLAEERYVQRSELRNLVAASRMVDPERRAASRLFLARRLIENGLDESAKEWLLGVIDEYPHTSASIEAEELLARRWPSTVDDATTGTQRESARQTAGNVSLFSPNAAP